MDHISHLRRTLVNYTICGLWALNYAKRHLVVQELPDPASSFRTCDSVLGVQSRETIKIQIARSEVIHRSLPSGSKVPKYSANMVSLVRIVLMVWGICFILGTWTLRVVIVVEWLSPSRRYDPEDVVAKVRGTIACPNLRMHPGLFLCGTVFWN